MSPTLIRLESETDFGSPIAMPISSGQQGAAARVAADRKIPVGNTGFWECTPGRFRRQVAEAEYSYFISGKGSFTPDGAAKIEFRAGDSIYFDANTKGEWEIVETVRKAYVIFQLTADHHPNGD